MKKLVLVGVLALAGCVSSNSAEMLSTVVATSQAITGQAPNITNDINLALASAEDLATRAEAIPNKTVSAAATKVAAYITKWQGKVTNASPKVAAALNEVNTAAAILLYVAALAGYPL